VLGKCRAQDVVVVGASRRVALTELFQQARRSLDVREEKGDRSVRELGHRGSSFAPASCAA